MLCEHQETRLTKRTIRGGSIQYVYQCLTCGRSMNQPISYERIRTEFAGQLIPAFNETLEAEATAARIAQYDAEREASRREWHSEYAQYLRGPKWAEKRRKVLERCKGVCEGCGDAKATEVHHLTYEHVYEEFLFELVGLCRACHDRIHPDRDERPSP